MISLNFVLGLVSVCTIFPNSIFHSIYLLSNEYKDLFIMPLFMRFFHVSVSWWFSAGIWVTASLLKSSGLFSVFWLISTMPQFGQFPQVPLFPRPLFLVRIIWSLYQEHKLPLVLASLLRSIDLLFPNKFQVLITHFTFLTFYSVAPPRQQRQQFCKFCLFLLLLLLIVLKSGRLAEIKWSLCISKSQWGLHVSFSRTDSGLCL